MNFNSQTNYDWPNPRGPRRTTGWTGSFSLILRGQDKLPFRQNEWPVPKGRLFPVSLRGFGDWPLVIRLVPPQIPSVKRPEWPNPRGPRQPRPQYTAGLNLALIYGFNPPNVPAGQMLEGPSRTLSLANEIVRTTSL